MNKKTYESAEFEVDKFTVRDIITTSEDPTTNPGLDGGDNGAAVESIV